MEYQFNDILHYLDIWLNSAAGVKYIKKQYQGNPEELLHILLEHLPLNLKVNYLMIDIHLGKGDMNSALLLAEKFFRANGDAQSTSLYIDVLLKSGEMEKAEKIRREWKQK